MYLPRILLFAALPFLFGANCLPKTVHVVSLGDYTLRYQATDRRLVAGAYAWSFSATLERVGSPLVTGPVAVEVTSLAPGVTVVAGDLDFPVPAPGPVATASLFEIEDDAVFDPASLHFAFASAPLPALDTSDPSGGATVAPSAWLVLDFAAPVPTAAVTGFGLDCGGGPLGLAVHPLAPERLVVNPDGDLPAGSACQLAWTGPGGATQLAFGTAAAGSAATVVYDRGDVGLFPPFPDDTLQVDDGTTATGLRNAVPAPTTRPLDVQQLAAGLLAETNELDGWSPIAGLVVLLSEAPDVASLPTSPSESLDPLAAIGLFDVDPASPSYGERHPFELTYRADSLPGDPGPTHQLVLYPSRPLEPEGRYALAVTRRLLAGGLRPFAADAYFVDALAPAQGGEPAVMPRTRMLLDEILPRLAQDTSPPIPGDDLALALSISVRSIDTLPDDVLAMRAQVEAMPAPSYTLNCSASGGDVAAICTGTWESPTWLQFSYLQRDGNGDPVQTGTRSVPFRLALPTASLSEPAPILMYQHGNPGSSGEVNGAANRVAGAGLAVIGFTDFLNQSFVDVNQQFIGIFGSLLISQDVPDYYVETYGNQLAFLKMIGSLGTLDVLPLGAPDGNPDLDPTLPLSYEGISFGGVHGAALVPYAPEIRAAALVAGGGGFTERIFLQDVTDPLGIGSFFFTTLPLQIPNVEVRDIWTGLMYFQTIYDDQEPNLHALFTYGPRRFEVAGTSRKASVMIVEGIEDSFSPSNAVRANAFAAGPIPQLHPIAVPATVLEQAPAPATTANIDAETTAGLVQYVPVGVVGIPPSPGCSGIWAEGHYCAQAAAEAVLQRTAFYRTAVDADVPTIYDPAFDGDGDGRPDVQEIAEGTDPNVAD